MKIAFIGLGNMGGGMAANLVKAGHSVNAFDLSAEALAPAVRETPSGAAQSVVRAWSCDRNPGVRHSTRSSPTMLCL